MGEFVTCKNLFGYHKALKKKKRGTFCLWNFLLSRNSDNKFNKFKKIVDLLIYFIDLFIYLLKKKEDMHENQKSNYLQRCYHI